MQSRAALPAGPCPAHGQARYRAPAGQMAPAGHPLPVTHRCVRAGIIARSGALGPPVASARFAFLPAPCALMSAGLNLAQLRAIHYTDGACLVLAGAGS